MKKDDDNEKKFHVLKDYKELKEKNNTMDDLMLFSDDITVSFDDKSLSNELLHEALLSFEVDMIKNRIILMFSSDSSFDVISSFKKVIEGVFTINIKASKKSYITFTGCEIAELMFNGQVMNDVTPTIIYIELDYKEFKKES